MDEPEAEILALPTDGRPEDLTSIQCDSVGTDEFVEPSHPTPEKEPPPELTLADKKQRRNVLYKIRQYMIKFSTALAEYKMEDVEELYNLDQLQDILEDMKFKVGANNSEKLYKGLYFTGVDVLEKIGVNHGMMIDGLTQSLISNPEVDLTLTEIAIDFSDYIYTDPISRLCFMTLQAAYALHNIRSHAPKNVSAEVKDKYKDL